MKLFWPTDAYFGLRAGVGRGKEETRNRKRKSDEDQGTEKRSSRIRREIKTLEVSPTG